MIRASRDRNIRLAALGIVGLPLAAPHAASADAPTWTRARAAHVEVLTDAPAEEARRMAASLERFRRLLVQLYGPPAPGSEGPAVVLALSDRQAFDEVVPRFHGRPVAADGFFQGASDGTFIVLPFAPDRVSPLEVVAHEYTHVFLSHRLPAQPPWVSEGLADLFSTWFADGETAVLGRPPASHLATLRGGSWIALPELLRIGYTSSAYHHGEGRSLMYAQSWALLHQQLIGRGRGASELGTFLQDIADGGDPVESFARAFDDPAQVEGPLRRYAALETLPTARVQVPGLQEPPAVTVEGASKAEIDYLKGDLLLAQGRLDDARRHLLHAVEQDARLAAAHARLAWVSLRRRKTEEAERHLKAALLAAPEDPRVLYGYADAIVLEAARRGEVLSEADTARAVAALEKAVAVAPQLADAADLLARLRPHPLDQRIPLLERAWAADRSRTSLAITLAGLHLKKNDYRRARSILARARQESQDEDMRFLCGHLLGRIGQVTAVTAEVTGVLSSLRCLPGGALRFVVESKGRSLQLHADSPLAILLYDANGQPLQRTLTCGPQGLPVTAWYRTTPESRPPGADGTVLSLAFQQNPPRP